MLIEDVESIKRFAVDESEFRKNPESFPMLYAVLYIKDYPVLCDAHLTYFSRFDGTEDERKDMAFYDVICELPDGYLNGIPKPVQFTCKLYSEKKEQRIRILKTRNAECCAINPDKIKPAEYYAMWMFKVKLYTTYEEALQQYNIETKKPEN